MTPEAHAPRNVPDFLPATAHELTEQADERFHNDPVFRARVHLAERAARERLEADGMTVTRSYRVAIRMGVIAALLVAEAPEGELVRTVVIPPPDGAPPPA